MRPLSSLCALALLAACPLAPTPKCEVDGGGPDFEVQLRFVNLGREAVLLRLEGEDGGQPVTPLGSVAKVGHTSGTRQRGSVEARNFLPDGGREAVTLPFEFDTGDGVPVTFVLRDSTPARISTNLTIAKQTQGATFGEKVRSSLEGVDVEGGVDTDADCLTDAAGTAGAPARFGLHGDPPEQHCPGTADELFVRPGEVDPDATPYFVRGRDGELQVAWVAKVQAGLQAAGGALAQGASLLGGSMPGGAVVSARVQPLYVLNADSSARPATVTLEGVEVATDVAPGALVRVKSNAVARAARKTVTAEGLRRGAIAGITVGGVLRTVELGTELTGPCQPPYLCDFLNDEGTLLVASENLNSSATVLKTRHEMAKNSIGNIRRPIVLSTTGVLETKGCVAVFPTDDTCVMGAAVVSSVSSLGGGAGGGAAAAAYAATGMMLYPPKGPTQGTAMSMGVVENGTVARRFLWDNPAGLTPSSVAQAPAGFAIVASGLVLDATAVDRRALFFVNTDLTPWTVQATLSK